MTNRILVVDDEKNIRSMVSMVLGSEGFSVEEAANPSEAEALLAHSVPDAILLDVRLPEKSGLDLLKVWKSQHPGLPIILMSGEASVSEALEGLKMGAYDFLEKPFRAEKLTNTLKRGIQESSLREQVSQDSDILIGSSPELMETMEQIKKVAPTNTRVLLLGESGTGKDLLAKAIHLESNRSQKRFVKVNCAAIAKDLLESELFGHVKGAFTGANTARKGMFESANGGTLFLDEVGELSLEAQAKMLRALQNSEITPVGSDKTVKVDVRIIAATNRDLKEEIQTGQFREDLYYRLAVLTVESPALRQRATDIPLLVNHFISRICAENGMGPKDVHPAVMQALVNYSWPGNIRELRNVIERLVILSGPVISIGDLPNDISKDNQRSILASSSSQMGSNVNDLVPWDMFKKKSESDYLITVLRQTDGNISEAARLLGVERTTIHKWIKAFGITKAQYLILG